MALVWAKRLRHSGSRQPERHSLEGPAWGWTQVLRPAFGNLQLPLWAQGQRADALEGLHTWSRWASQAEGGRRHGSKSPGTLSMSGTGNLRTETTPGFRSCHLGHICLFFKLEAGSSPF